MAEGTPGPTNTLLATSGASLGFRRSLQLVPAELLGYLTAVSVIDAVLGASFLTWPWLKPVLQAFVVLYLVVLAVRLWRASSANVKTGSSVTPRSVFVTTMLNPKAVFFALFVIPHQSDQWVSHFAAFGAFVCAMSLVWIAIGTAIGRGLLPVNSGSFVTRVGAAVIASFAGVAAWSTLKGVLSA